MATWKVWLDENKRELPKPDDRVLNHNLLVGTGDLVGINQEGISDLFWFMNCVMPCVQKFWVGCSFGASYSEKVFPSDEAFRLFLLQYYRKMPEKGKKRVERASHEVLCLSIELFYDAQRRSN